MSSEDRMGYSGNQSVRHVVTLSSRRFDVKQLPADIFRVYSELEGKYGEEYALHFVFMMRTAVELHRAWNMSILTSAILQRIKDKFDIRMTWNLGVLKLKFRVEDGGHEIQRKVPYDYDSEYQSMYFRIAVALIKGHISVHDALVFQTETKDGAHTARSLLFLRDFPGRLIIYPFQAATCALIFFDGDWNDVVPALVCGFVTGLVEYALSSIGGDALKLLDISVGLATGIVGSLFYRFTYVGGETPYCLTSIFMGTLYWFFYGTAFVIGLLEIIAGEFETGVTRFIAVTVKTFVLCLGASLGMLFTVKDPRTAWSEQYCDPIFDIKEGGERHTWRIPFFVLCSVFVLGQYRAPIYTYPLGLIVMTVGWWVQTETFEIVNKSYKSDNDFLDASASNVLGAMAAVLSASALKYFLDSSKDFYYARLLQRENRMQNTCYGNCVYKLISRSVRLVNCLKLGRISDVMKLKMEKKLKQSREELDSPDHTRMEIDLNAEEQGWLTEALVDSQEINIWAILMPAVYQLVPGSVIAKLWFGVMFSTGDTVFENLMVIACSLALGLVLGNALVQVLQKVLCCGSKSKRKDEERTGSLYMIPGDTFDDPDDKMKGEE
mmetsp:Transcript_32438/g.64308  ORF Transcript_32438/g.64308 Transcript_32438/m.64308 type:complete len:607 (+) Transcript_32438:160-1980(+)